MMWQLLLGRQNKYKKISEYLVRQLSYIKRRQEILFTRALHLKLASDHETEMIGKTYIVQVHRRICTYEGSYVRPNVAVGDA